MLHAPAATAAMAHSPLPEAPQTATRQRSDIDLLSEQMNALRASPRPHATRARERRAAIDPPAAQQIIQHLQAANFDVRLEMATHEASEHSSSKAVHQLSSTVLFAGEIPPAFSAAPLQQGQASHCASAATQPPPAAQTTHSPPFARRHEVKASLSIDPSAALALVQEAAAPASAAQPRPSSHSQSGTGHRRQESMGGMASPGLMFELELSPPPQSSPDRSSAASASVWGEWSTPAASPWTEHAPECSPYSPAPHTDPTRTRALPLALKTRLDDEDPMGVAAAPVPVRYRGGGRARSESAVYRSLRPAAFASTASTSSAPAVPAAGALLQSSAAASSSSSSTTISSSSRPPSASPQSEDESDAGPWAALSALRFPPAPPLASLAPGAPTPVASPEPLLRSTSRVAPQQSPFGGNGAPQSASERLAPRSIAGQLAGLSAKRLSTPTRTLRPGMEPVWPPVAAAPTNATHNDDVWNWYPPPDADPVTYAPDFLQPSNRLKQQGMLSSRRWNKLYDAEKEFAAHQAEKARRRKDSEDSLSVPRSPEPRTRDAGRGLHTESNRARRREAMNDAAFDDAPMFEMEL